MSKKTHEDLEFAVNDLSGTQRIFKTFDEAMGFSTRRRDGRIMSGKIVFDREFEDLYRQYQSLGKDSEAMSQVLLGTPIYERRVKMPKWSVPVSMLTEPKVALKHGPSWGITTSKSENALLANDLIELKKRLDDEWNSTADLAVEAYGDGTGSLISGVYRDHFPDDVKNRLRFLAHGSSMVGSAARLHRLLSKTTSPQFQ